MKIACTLATVLKVLAIRNGLKNLPLKLAGTLAMILKVPAIRNGLKNLPVNRMKINVAETYPFTNTVIWNVQTISV